tara:strand:- start:494 stop:901 length:408 start_codon:yes stop_codon:yes gene_type:complete
VTKSKKRIKKTGEVFTPEWLVDEMLDRLPLDLFKSPSKTYLDPACGSGNILVRVLDKKIKSGSTPLQALQSIYGVDLMADNIWECRKRLFEVTYSYDKKPTKEWKTALLTNIRCANTLEKSLEEIFNAPPDEVDT